MNMHYHHYHDCYCSHHHYSFLSKRTVLAHIHIFSLRVLPQVIILIYLLIYNTFSSLFPRPSSPIFASYTHPYCFVQFSPRRVYFITGWREYTLDSMRGVLYSLHTMKSMHTLSTPKWRAGYWFLCGWLVPMSPSCSRWITCKLSRINVTSLGNTREIL